MLSCTFAHGELVKAVILAGGEGTRLRPLTLAVPKPIVPIVDRPFLRHQLDLLGDAGVTEVVFSVAYRPERVQAIFGDGSALGKKIRYAMEPTPLGTGGAVKNAERYLDDVTVVLNGDVLTDLDLAAVLRRHQESRAAATLVLAPVPDPAAYGLVETDGNGRVRRFIEKPQPDQITTDTINAGIYVLQTSTLELMPAGVNHSIERAFFPALLGRGDHVAAHVHRGYWIDIGTPAKYLQVHRDVLSGRFPVRLDGRPVAGGWVHEGAVVEPGAELRGPFYVGPGSRVSARAEVGPHAVLASRVRVEAGARIRDSVLWEGCQIGEEAAVEGALLGAGVRAARHVVIGPGAVLGEGSSLSDYSRTA
jgi:NDP-sugar pyrophosphorylase family protein